MNPREKRLAIIVGIFGCAFVVWLGVNKLFVDPIRVARTARANHEEALRQLDKLDKQTKKQIKQWKIDSARTFSFDETLARDMLGLELKRIANKCGFDAPNVRPSSGLRVASKSKLKTVANQVSLTGDYSKALGFLKSIYESPFLCQVTSLTLTPLGPRYGRNNVKLDVTVETLVLPSKFKDVPLDNPPPTTMPDDPNTPLPPFRRELAASEYFAVLEDRNILREFIAPPDTTVMLDNQDRKMVGVKAEFLWDGKVETQSQQGVEGKKQVQINGKGDAVRITVAYADGHTVGPVEHPFNGAATWAYKVESHTEPEPPKLIDLAVNNTNAEEVMVNLIITTEDGKQLTPPTMLIDASKTIDLGEWPASQIQLTAKYKSGKPAPGGNYTPTGAKQTLMIPPEPAEVVIDTGDHEPPAVDPAADSRYTVSGIWTYRDTQEMIVTSVEGRKVITAGEVGAVDGGELLAVHPLGGIVYMPGTKHYYLYPLGKSFSERVVLDGVSEEEQLADAIDAWSRQ